jgi:poly-gamma-glutamate biosynthesis protein PgsC/CapC
MNELLPLSIGIGLAVSLMFSELFGLAAGGMVVPGYFALYLHKPLDVLLTVGAGLLTFAIVHALSSVMIIYGKRRTVLMILVGYLLGGLARALADASFAGAMNLDLRLIGYVIPGLIAIWIERQGFVETLSAMITASVVVRLILVLVAGAELSPS